jgi:hypothetical protein
MQPENSAQSDHLSRRAQNGRGNETERNSRHAPQFLRKLMRTWRRAMQRSSVRTAAVWAFLPRSAALRGPEEWVGFSAVQDSRARREPCIHWVVEWSTERNGRFFCQADWPSQSPEMTVCPSCRDVHERGPGLFPALRASSAWILHRWRLVREQPRFIVSGDRHRLWRRIVVDTPPVNRHRGADI